MNIKAEALNYAIEAHEGQKRKTEPDKPMIIHPINVGHIIEKYGFDDNVIAAGYLHDVVEDTSYTIQDIEGKFGDDVASLVLGASEPDKSLSWEERKLHTIEGIKSLDLRHKAVVCADKISNLEDLMILFDKKGEYDFGAFKRGEDKQKWYYESIYNSLITNEDSNLPMFKELKELIDSVFYKKENDYLKNEIIGEEEYKELKKLDSMSKEIYKLKNTFDTTPYVIEFTGTPRTGKTTLINNLYDFFKKSGMKVTLLEEFTTSKEYKEGLYPSIKDEPKDVINSIIPIHVFKQLTKAVSSNPDVILIDRSLFDRLVWIDRLHTENGISDENYETYKDIYIPIIKEGIHTIISTYVGSKEAIKRDYKANLSLKPRHFLNEKNVDEYNEALNNMTNLLKDELNIHSFDTTNKNQREVSFLVAEAILKDMRYEYIKRINYRLDNPIITSEKVKTLK